MSQFTNLQVSISSLIHETNRITRFIDSRFTNLIFYPSIFDADVDYKSFCSHYNSVRNFSTLLDNSPDHLMIKEKFSALPNLTVEEFEYHKFILPSYLLLILLPVGVVVWFNSYLKLSALLDKLKAIEGTLNTIHFFARAYSN